MEHRSTQAVMAKTLLPAILPFLVLLTTLNGCSKGNSDLVSPAPEPIVAWVQTVFPHPIKNTSDAMAVQVVGYIQSIDQMATAPKLRPFDTVQVATFKNINQWTLLSGGITEILTKTTVGDSVFGSLLTYTGSQSGKVYLNALAFRDSNRVDGKYGSWTVYYAGVVPLVVTETFVYRIDPQGNRTAQYTNLGNQQITIADSVNGTGTLTVGKAIAPPPGDVYLPVLKALWLADGSGQWTTYTNITQTGTGIWGK
jgi:hypothetical protein